MDWSHSPVATHQSHVGAESHALPEAHSICWLVLPLCFSLEPSAVPAFTLSLQIWFPFPDSSEPEAREKLQAVSSHLRPEFCPSISLEVLVFLSDPSSFPGSIPSAQIIIFQCLDSELFRIPLPFSLKSEISFIENRSIYLLARLLLIIVSCLEPELIHKSKIVIEASKLPLINLLPLFAGTVL